MSVIDIRIPDLKQAAIESVASLITASIPIENKINGLTNIVIYVDNNLLIAQNEGYKLCETTAMKQYHKEMKRNAVEGLMMLSQQPAKTQ